MSNKLTNEEIVARKATVKKQIEYLTSKTGNPTAYSLSNGNPYTGSKQAEDDKKKLRELVDEYNSLIVSIVVANLRLNKVITFTDGNYVIRYVPKKDRYDFYIGSEYKRGKVEFNEDLTEATVTCPTVNSDTHGETVNYIYKVKINEPKDVVVKKTNPKPCGMVEEGLAMVREPDASFMERCGYVKDPVYNKWRRQSPSEMQAKIDQAKPKPTKKGFSGHFSFKRK